jgi:hypothetical protein
METRVGGPESGGDGFAIWKGGMAYVGGDDSWLGGTNAEGTRNLKIEENIQVICHFKWNP